MRDINRYASWSQNNMVSSLQVVKFMNVIELLYFIMCVKDLYIPVIGDHILEEVSCKE